MVAGNDYPACMDFLNLDLNGLPCPFASQVSGWGVPVHASVDTMFSQLAVILRLPPRPLPPSHFLPPPSLSPSHFPPCP